MFPTTVTNKADSYVTVLANVDSIKEDWCGEARLNVLVAAGLMVFDRYIVYIVWLRERRYKRSI